RGLELRHDRRIRERIEMDVGDREELLRGCGGCEGNEREDDCADSLHDGYMLPSSAGRVGGGWPCHATSPNAGRSPSRLRFEVLWRLAFEPELLTRTAHRRIHVDVKDTAAVAALKPFLAHDFGIRQAPKHTGRRPAEHRTARAVR